MVFVLLVSVHFLANYEVRNKYCIFLVLVLVKQTTLLHGYNCINKRKLFSIEMKCNVGMMCLQKGR